MNGIETREAVVDAIEEVLLVALVVENCELWRIKKAARVQAIDFYEVAPVLSAIGEIEARRYRAETIRMSW